MWQGDITGYDEALQLVLIMDYIVDWARDIFRPSIMRQLMSVVDKGEQSSYTIVDQPDILSIHDPANSRYGGRPVPTIAGAGTFEAPAESAFDAVHSTISSSFEPLFESTGKHVDIKVWESAKYESRVRGLFITEHDSAAMKHLTTYGYKRLETVYMSRCWFLLPNSKDIRTIEEAWTGSTPAEIKDVSDPSEQKILISLYVQFRNDEFGAPIRELTYLAFTGSVVKQMRYERDINGILERDELVASPEVLGLKLSEAWTSSHNNYFQRYASGEISVLRVTASDHDKMSDSVSLSFLNDRDTTNYARRLDSFIKNICEHPRASLHKVYAPCFRYTKVVHSLTVKPHCILDPTQACVFINAKAMPSGICIYAKNGASEKTNHEWVIRHLVQIVVVLWDSQWPDTKGSFYIRRYMFESHYIDSKILLWIVSDPQWDLYTAMKPSLTMPGTERVHEHLAWFRKVLLTHKCGTGTIRSNVTGCGAHRAGYRNVQRHIQEACKKCDYDTSFVAPKFPFCDEDFMPGGFDGNLKESSVH